MYRYVGNSAPNFIDPSGLTQAGNPLNNLFSELAPSLGSFNFSTTRAPSLTTKPFASLPTSSFVGPARGLDPYDFNATVVPPAPPSSLYVSGPTLTQSEVMVDFATRVQTSEYLSENRLLIAPRHVTQVTPIRMPGGGEEFRRVLHSAADSYYSNVTGTNDALSPLYYTDGINRLFGGALELTGDVIGGIGDMAAPSFTNTLIEYSDHKNPTYIPGSPSSGQFADQALLFAYPLFGGSSRPAGQLTFGTGARTSSSLPELQIINPEFVPNGRTIVAVTAQEQADRGAASLVQSLSRPQQRVYNANPAGGSRFLGTAVHKQTDRTLQSLYPERFTYNPSYGPDFFDATTGGYIELTTPGQVARHGTRGGLYNNVEYATYVLP